MKDGAVSNQHAVIVYQEDKFSIYDLSSTNGTFVNGKRVKQQVLKHEDYVIIGGNLLQFQHTHNYTVLQEFNNIWSEFVDNVDAGPQIAGEKTAKKITDYLANAIDVSTPDCTLDMNWCYSFVLDTSIVFAETQLPASLPIAYSIDRVPTWDNVEQLRRSLLTEGMQGIVSILLLVLPVEKVSDDDLRSLLRTSRSHSLDLVFVGFQDLKDIVLSQDTRRALRKIVLASIQLRSGLSPFVETGPTTAPMFFGRERKLRDIVEKADVASFAIIGGRRIGKTSMLLRLYQTHLPQEGFRTIYYDCSSTLSYQDFLSESIRGWYPSPPKDAPNTFSDLLESPLMDKPLVLLLDEADQLVSIDRAEGWRMFHTLRKTANYGQMKFVFAGEHELQKALRDADSPLFNFANEVRLGRLEVSAVNELVTRSMRQLEIELVDESAIVRQIYDFTSGHPNVVQRLCRRLIDRLGDRDDRRITSDDVKAITDDPQFQREDFLSTYWESATLLEQIISLLMVSGKGGSTSRTERAKRKLDEIFDVGIDNGSINTLSEVQQALNERCDLHPTLREIDNALDRLVNLRSILQRTATGYEFAVEAFPRVVVGTLTLADMLEVLVEDYKNAQGLSLNELQDMLGV